MILTEEQSIAIVKQESTSISDRITLARNKAKELDALINGIDFADELIERIEFLESDTKAKSRKKHARNIVDLFERIMLPISNVFVASGGSKKYFTEKIAESDAKLFMSSLSNLKDGKSVEKYTENTWMPLYHSDPNGIIFMEYVTDPNPKCYPTYKSIGVIRNYLPKGQLMEWVLFESKSTKEKPEEKTWRIVCDKYDRTISQIGTLFTIVEDKTFEHPFGEVPAFINSDIIDLKDHIRKSPFDKIIAISKEYARDQSFLSIYKPLHGSPLHWKYVTQCKTCTGIKKVNGKPCGDCDGHGYYKGKDVTDIVTIPVPKKDEQKLDPISGYISPDLETWGQYNEELEKLEVNIQDTHWGSHVEKTASTNETATGRFIDVQPVINRLNKYADVAEWVEWKLTEMLANFIIATKDKSTSIASIVYGRRYIIDSPDTIFERYNKAKESGESNTILDRLFNEFLLSKYKNDPEWLKMELIKSQVEPYLHITLSDTNSFFGQIEASKKVFFKSWWDDNSNLEEIKEPLKAKAKFEKDFKVYQATITIINPNPQAK